MDGFRTFFYIKLFHVNEIRDHILKDKDSRRSNHACKCVRVHVRGMAGRRLNEDKSRIEARRGNAPDRSFCDEVEKLRALDRRSRRIGTITLPRHDAYRTVRTIKLIYE